MPAMLDYLRSKVSNRIEQGKVTDYQNKLKELNTPTYGLNQYMRMAGSAQPTLASMLAYAAARGGSMQQGQEAAEAQAYQARTGAYDAWTNFKSAIDAQVLGELGDADALSKQMAFQAQQDAAARKSSFWNNVLGIGGAVAGQYLGARWGSGNMSASPSVSSRYTTFQMPTYTLPQATY